MNINAIHNRARRYMGAAAGEITYLCGCSKLYRAVSAYGFAMVAGMSAQVLCDSCEDRRMHDAAVAAEQLPTLRVEYARALRVRDVRMAELGIDSVYDARISDLQAAVLRADAAMTNANRLVD